MPSEKRYLVTCECEVLVRADDEDDAGFEAMKVLDSEADIISGKVLDVNPAGNMDERLTEMTIRFGEKTDV